jgi:hypothetical protein
VEVTTTILSVRLSNNLSCPTLQPVTAALGPVCLFIYLYSGSHYSPGWPGTQNLLALVS